MSIMHDRKLLSVGIVTLSLGYLAYIGMWVHTIVYNKLYAGLNFIAMLEAMYMVVLFWLLCCSIAFVSLSYLILKGRRNFQMYVLLLASITPIGAWAFDIFFQNI